MSGHMPLSDARGSVCGFLTMAKYLAIYKLSRTQNRMAVDAKLTRIRSDFSLLRVAAWACPRDVASLQGRCEKKARTPMVWAVFLCVFVVFFCARLLQADKPTADQIEPHSLFSL